LAGVRGDDADADRDGCWEHTHEFEEDGPRATVIRDRVRYSLPFGPLGTLAERLLVRRDLRQIFDYRRDAVAREMSPAGSVVPGGDAAVACRW
jgi:ligand-binding SRPBCC domain-containing protein